MNKKAKVSAENMNAEPKASIDGMTKDKDRLAAQKKEAGASVPMTPVKYKNPGIFSMGAAFLVGILMSLLFPEKMAADKFTRKSSGST